MVSSLSFGVVPSLLISRARCGWSTSREGTAQNPLAVDLHGPGYCKSFRFVLAYLVRVVPNF